jgi:hypothetical protein
MKLAIIVLLIAAIGGGVYYYFTQKKHRSSSHSNELILGKWKIDSLSIIKSKELSADKLLSKLAVADSNCNRYEFEFSKNNSIYQNLDGKAKDTSHYELVDEKNILIWNGKDSSKTKFGINQLDSAKLVVQDKDSVLVTFKKVK